jgi:hypothetical protein
MYFSKIISNGVRIRFFLNTNYGRKPKSVTIPYGVKNTWFTEESMFI